MDATSFLIAHGEKLVVAAVAGGCALVLWSAIDDPSIRPLENQTQIEAINAKIDEVFKKQSPPVVKDPRPYLDQLLARLGEPIPATPVMAWLTTPPDKGRRVGPGSSGTYLYVYELLAPSVRIEDAVGSLRISLTPPVVVAQGSARRVSPESSRTWERIDREPIVNTARHLGVLLQIRLGDREWRPLVLPGASPEGVLPITDLPASAVTIPTPEPWQRHRIRARIIAATTALDLDGPAVERPRHTVAVHPGQLSEGPLADQALIDRALTQIAAKDGPLFKAFLRPAADAPLPPNVTLAPGERLFLGPWSPDTPDTVVDATASVRFALVGLTTIPDPAAPATPKDAGRFLLLRLFQQGDQQAWMKEPLERRFALGDVLSIPEALIDHPFIPGQRIRTDLTTPFVVERLVKSQKRIQYWWVRPKSRAAGGRDRDLELGNREVNTDIAVLKNPETGFELVLTKLDRIVPPPRTDTLIYPHQAGTYTERDVFVASPSEFRQWDLAPESPKAHQPETGPLAELYQQKIAEGALDAEAFRTDTVYYAFPDGRIVWWEHLINHKLRWHDPEGVMTPKVETPDAPATVEPAPGMPPEMGAPPGLPPGMGGPPPPPPRGR